MDWLKQIAPTIATAMGGPFGTLAYGVVSKVMGISPEDAQKTIESGRLTADQIAQIKLAEIELQKQAQELGLNFEKLSVEDRKSARDMQAATRSIVPPALAAIITVGFFSILIMMMLGKVDGNNPTILMMLGSLSTAWTGIIAYYFGSSAGSQAKTDLLSKAPAIK